MLNLSIKMFDNHCLMPTPSHFHWQAMIKIDVWSGGSTLKINQFAIQKLRAFVWLLSFFLEKWKKSDWKAKWYFYLKFYIFYAIFSLFEMKRICYYCKAIQFCLEHTWCQKCRFETDHDSHFTLQKCLNTPPWLHVGYLCLKLCHVYVEGLYGYDVFFFLKKNHGCSNILHKPWC